MSVHEVETGLEANSRFLDVLTIQLKAGAAAVRRTIAPEIKTPSFDKIPLKAVTEVLARDPEVSFEFLEQVAATGLALDEPDTKDILPLLETTAGALHTEIEGRTRDSKSGSKLRHIFSTDEVLAAFTAYDAHRCEETKRLVDLAISQSSSYDRQMLYLQALAASKNSGRPILDCYHDIVAASPSWEPSREDPERYEWLHTDGLKPEPKPED